MKKLLLTACLLALPSFAMEGGFIGVGLGVAGGTEDGQELGFGANVHGGIRLTEDWDVGLEVQQYFNPGEGLIDSSTSFPIHLIGAYRFDSLGVEGLWASLGLGFTHTRVTVTGLTGDSSDTDFSAGLGLGYGFGITDSMSIGPSFRYTQVFADTSFGIWALAAEFCWDF